MTSEIDALKYDLNSVRVQMNRASRRARVLGTSVSAQYGHNP